MIPHDSFYGGTFQISRQLFQLIVSGDIQIAGNRKLKIYGILDCPSGKRMKNKNRVFFKSEQEAICNGYRPCGRCMPPEYKIWKTISANGLL